MQVVLRLLQAVVCVVCVLAVGWARQTHLSHVALDVLLSDLVTKRSSHPSSAHSTFHVTSQGSTLEVWHVQAVLWPHCACVS